MDEVLFSTKSAISFNSIYVIQSLGEDDRKTGTELCRYLKPLTDTLGCVNLSLIDISNREGWNQAVSHIKRHTESGERPIIHIEMHGHSNRSGLVTNGGDVLIWEDILKDLSMINYASGCNLMATFAVCFGLNIYKHVSLRRAMPFCYTIGSMGKMYEPHIEICFQEFYGSLLRYMDIDRAYEALKHENPGMPQEYISIKSDVLFAYVHRVFYSLMDNPISARSVAEAEINKHPNQYANSDEFEEQVKAFIEYENTYRQEMYTSDIVSFFQLDRFPNNRERFWIVDNVEDLNNIFMNN